MKKKNFDRSPVMFLKRDVGQFPVGIWIALVALLFAMLAWAMQMYSLFDWEGAIKLGVQSESFSGDSVERALANVEWGIAWADMIWPLPLTIIALIGIWRSWLIGFTAAMMNYAICIYFPLFFAFQRWNTQFDVVLGALFLFALPSIFGIIGLWTNREEFLKTR